MLGSQANTSQGTTETGKYNSMDPVRAYRETQIKTASQGKLILMLYDEAIRRVDLATTELSGGTPCFDAASNDLVKAQDIVTELIVSLDFEKGGDIARSLFSLYMFFNRQLIDANMKKEPAALKEVREMLAALRAAWAEIEGKAGIDPTEAPTRGVNIAG